MYRQVSTYFQPQICYHVVDAEKYNELLYGRTPFGFVSNIFPDETTSI